jgi:hypothetical protein
MSKYPVKLLFIALLASTFTNSLVQAEESAPVIKNENLVDNLTMTAVGMLTTNLNGYKQTEDVSLAVKGGSKFVEGDILLTSKEKAASKILLEDFSNSTGSAADKKQLDSLVVLRKSYKDAFNVASSKLGIQKGASSSFAEANSSALKLAAKEQLEEKKCTQGLSTALTTVADGINQKCSEMGKDPLKQEDAQKCSDELAKCVDRVLADKNQFDNYIKTRNSPMASIEGLKIVTELRDQFLVSLGGSSKVCSNYSKPVADSEASGRCADKMSTDKKNESSGKLDKSPQGDTLSKMGLDSKSGTSFITVAGKKISKDLDLSMLIPENRAVVWAGMQELSDSAAVATSSEMEKVQVIITKMDKILKDMGSLPEGTVSSNTSSGEFDNSIGIVSNGGTVVSVGVIKKFFATNPTPDDILREAAALGLDKWQIAQAMNIAGYDGEKPSDPNSFAQTQALNNKFVAKIEQFVATKNGNFNGPQGSVVVPGLARIDSTKNVMSNQGWLTPSIVKTFLDTNPTDQQFFEKMSELGLRKRDIGSILNGQGMLFKDGNPTQSLMNDKDFGSIFNRLDIELYQGVTGYGVTDTYDVNSLIVKGTGHISDEETKSWVPYGFNPAKVNQMTDTRNQAPVPTTFITGGRFGAGAKAVKTIKVISSSEMKKLTTK